MKMDIAMLILYLQILLHRFYLATACTNQKSLLLSRNWDITSRHIREYLRHMSCSQIESELTFHRLECQIECLRQDGCLGLRYVSFCELCIYSSTRFPGELILDSLYVTLDEDIINQNLGKTNCILNY